MMIILPDIHLTSKGTRLRVLSHVVVIPLTLSDLADPADHCKNLLTILSTLSIITL